MGIPFDSLSSASEHSDGEVVSKASSDSLFWSTTAFDTVPAFLVAELRSVRLLARPQQSYFVYDGNASILEARTCHMRVVDTELIDRISPSSFASPSETVKIHSVEVLFFCSRWCCEPDCCQLKASIWLIAFFSVCSLLLYLLYFCANDYRRRELMRKIFKNYRPVRRSNALRKKSSSVGMSTTRARWKDAPKISIEPPTPSNTVAVECDAETAVSFNFADNDVIL
ncbi:hypothetical protein PMAYCL1PPCAC_27526 [Pristionchus mayeri]|uniref:CX domain-containing protein n=1 Tax=Pristionchus mayeri TaxID=1317129 RepID=A0AAN5IC51_9BILA|nr:hypothetical protein PMAYCL1PPCAC_27526 [Pristionchus mayeri]